MLKINIELLNGLPEDEITIRCSRVDDTINRIHQFILQQTDAGPKITFYKQNEEYYFPLDNVLFFETEGERVYAHTQNDAYRIKYRLYELSEILPRKFARAAKSCIVNTSLIHSITRNLTASSLIRFNGSHKQVYVSRHYYHQLKERINERSSYEK